MAAITLVPGTKTQLTSTAYSTLASATYCASAVYSSTANRPLEVMIEVTATTTASPTGNKQVVVFCQASYTSSSTGFQSGPNSGTTTTWESNLTFLGTVMPSSVAVERKSFPLSPSYGGVVPPWFQIVTKNDSGVAMSTGNGENSIYTVEFTGSVA